MPRTVAVSPVASLALLAAWTVAAALWFVSPAFPMQALAGWQADHGGLQGTGVEAQHVGRLAHGAHQGQREVGNQRVHLGDAGGF